jgi:hypothetical protein
MAAHSRQPPPGPCQPHRQRRFGASPLSATAIENYVAADDADWSIGVF